MTLEPPPRLLRKCGTGAGATAVVSSSPVTPQSFKQFTSGLRGFLALIQPLP